jgi:hypothetical protein
MTHGLARPGVGSAYRDAQVVQPAQHFLKRRVLGDKSLVESP